MTKCQQRLREELIRRRNYAAATIRRYLEALQACEQAHRRRRLDQLGADDLRRYHASLFADRKLAVGTTLRIRPFKTTSSAGSTAGRAHAALTRRAAHTDGARAVRSGPVENASSVTFPS